MIRKIGAFSVVTAMLFLAVTSFAESPSTMGTANGSILVLSTEETGVPGYVHEKYVFIHPDCFGGQIVDRTGPPIDPNDANLLWSEYQTCLRNSDGGDSDGG
jgi:hypothetical protein